MRADVFQPDAALLPLLPPEERAKYSADGLLPMEMPEARDPNARERPVDVRCRFCGVLVPDDDGLRAWRSCGPCLDAAEF